MSKYKAGDKFIIEIEEAVKDNLYRIKNMHGMVLDDDTLDKLKSLKEKI